MSKNSEDYWRKREEEQRKHNIKDEQEFRKELEKMYRATLKEVNDQIYAFYAKYALQNAITMAEAKRRADKLDIEAYAEKAKRYVKEKNFSEQANKEMRIYNLTMKANRLELLKAEIGLELCANADEVDDFMREELEGRILNEIERQAGILGKSIQDNRKFAQALVNASFHNATFSDRIWANQALLRNELSNILTTALIQGRNPRDFISQVRKRFDVSTNNAYRLLVTELARVQTSAQMESFKRNGFDKYTFLALGTACEICRKIDGKHFDVDKANAGVNMPPMHPNCRCSTSAYMDDDEYNAWLDGYKDHGMDFDNWKKSKILAKEQSLRTKNGGEYGVNWKKVRSKEYNDRFNLLSDNPKANALAVQRARNALINRSGKNTEEIYAISLSTGKDVSSITNQHYAFGVQRTEKFSSDIKRAEDRGERILLIHNHPRGTVPSLADLNELLNHKNTVGITVGHNGTIYFYTKPNSKVTDRDLKVALLKQKGYNFRERDEDALRYLAKQFDFEFKVL